MSLFLACALPTRIKLLLCVNPSVCLSVLWKGWGSPHQGNLVSGEMWENIRELTRDQSVTTHTPFCERHSVQFAEMTRYTSDLAKQNLTFAPKTHPKPSSVDCICCLRFSWQKDKRNCLSKRRETPKELHCWNCMPKTSYTWFLVCMGSISLGNLCLCQNTGGHLNRNFCFKKDTHSKFAQDKN